MIKGTTSIFKASRNISPIHSTFSIEVPNIHPEKIPRKMPVIIRIKSPFFFIVINPKKQISSKLGNWVYNTE
jgi:hypothetical protein